MVKFLCETIEPNVHGHNEHGGDGTDGGLLHIGGGSTGGGLDSHNTLPVCVDGGG